MRIRSLRTAFGAAVTFLMAWPGAIATAAPPVGIMVDAGVPDGLSGSLVLQPSQRFRLHVGGAYNLVAPGVRGGVSFAVLPAFITTTLNVEAGRFFPGDANPLARRLTGDATLNSAPLSAIGYDFASAHVGFELGFRRVTAYLHMGASVIRGTVTNVEFMAEPAILGTRLELRSDLTLQVFTPSARAGFIVYL